jgi:hypothetical protein
MSQAQHEVDAQLEKERTAEKEAEVKMLHVPMKQWFNNSNPKMPNPAAAAFKVNFGAFPGFWQDLLKWEFYAVVRKQYLAAEGNGYKGA